MNRRTFLKTAMLAAAGGPVMAADTSRRPNVVFFEVDDLLYRFTGRTGRGFVMTPNLDALAKEGVYFSNAVCQGMMCGPSRNSLITGLYPHNLGFYRNGQLKSLPDHVWSLPEAMKRAGYATAWVGKCHVHPPRNGTKRLSASEGLKQNMGFDFAVASVGRAMLASRVIKGRKLDGDVYIEHLRKRGLLETYIRDCKNRASVTSLPEDDYLDGFYTRTAVEWLKSYRQKKPFFLWLNLSCPHGPHDVPQKYHDLYKDREIPPPMTDSFGDAEIPDGLLRDTRPASPKKTPELRRGYAAAVTFVDAMLGRVIDALKQNGTYEQTVFVFFSDQGIFMGNHGRYHKGTVFNEITNPCLIVRGPKPFRRGVVDTHPVELLSLVKTTLDIAGAPESDRRIPFGESLLPLLTGKGTYGTRYAFSEIEGFQACVDGRYRFIAGGEKPLLYDLKNDPLEMKNVAESYPEVVRRFREALARWFRETGSPLPAGSLKDPERLRAWKPPKR